MSRALPLGRAIAAAALGTTLVAGAAAPALANPADAAKTLAGMKAAWGLKAPAQQAAECRVYSAHRTAAVNNAVIAIHVLPQYASHLTAAETLKVAKRYLHWACSGPGGSPRR